MISRRLLRIKIVQVLYAYFTDENSSIDKSDKELQLSIKKAYDLYHYFILLLIDVADYADERIELARNKILPSKEELNPNKKFVNNMVIRQLKDCSDLTNYVSQAKITWASYPEIIRSLYLKISESEYFQAYMNADETSYDLDKKLLVDILTTELEEWELLYQMLEEQSIYWNDDIEFVIGMLLKTIQKFKSTGPSIKLMELYKNDEDREFGKTLLRKTILKHKEYRETIDKYTQNWEIDRIAIMDVLIMEVALSEMLEFPSIPLKVTFNEYIDIARFYSTPKSNEFVNGVLDKIVIDLKKENKIIKTGRGLLGEFQVSE